MSWQVDDRSDNKAKPSLLLSTIISPILPSSSRRLFLTLHSGTPSTVPIRRRQSLKGDIQKKPRTEDNNFRCHNMGYYYSCLDSTVSGHWSLIIIRLTLHSAPFSWISALGDAYRWIAASAYRLSCNGQVYIITVRPRVLTEREISVTQHLGSTRDREQGCLCVGGCWKDLVGTTN